MSSHKSLLPTLLALLVCLAGSAQAYQVETRALVDRAAEAVAVIRGRVLEGVQVEIVDSAGAAPISCGFNFCIRVSEALRGSAEGEEIIAFRSMDQLRVGGDYLILLSSVDLGGEVSFTAMGRDRPDLLARCRASAPSLFASSFHGELFEFDEFALANTGEDWVKVIGEMSQMPEGVEAREVTISDSSSPIYRLVSWTNLRAALKRAQIPRSLR